ncbi:MAG: serine protease [Desulfovibrio sp.]|jgi:S1-C subfamily serine protease|nr:serine protease [Desulfovibrio sp.]
MKHPIQFFLCLAMLCLSAGCALRTNATVTDQTALGNKDVDFLIVSDAVDDELGIGPDIVAILQEHGFNATLGSTDEAFSQTGTGSGFVIADGYWLTNNHVVEGLTSYSISTAERLIPATVVDTDPKADLALLKAETGDLKPFRPGRAQVGEEIFVIGFPVPTLLGRHPRVTAGIISSLVGIHADPTRIQFSAAIQPGNSGGPVINQEWQMVAVTVSTGNIKRNIQGESLPQGMNFGVAPGIVKGLLMQNHVPLKGPFVSNLDEAIASTGLVWNGDFGQIKRQYVIRFACQGYWDFGFHLSALQLFLQDRNNGEIVAKTITRSTGLGVSMPVRNAVETLLEKMELSDQ